MKTATATAEATPTFDPTAPAALQALAERYERLPIDWLRESPFNPRKTFKPASLKDLADSILEKDVIEPIVVRPWKEPNNQIGTGPFEIICGARRFRAASAVSKTHLPAIIRQYSDLQVIEIMAIENGQRDDVPPLEEAAGYKQLLLIDKTYTPAMIATKTGHPERYIWDRLKLLDLVPQAQQLLAEERIGVEHAEVLAKLKPAEQIKAINPSSGGLFESDMSLAFDDNPDAKHKTKPRSVRELKDWIAHHIRLDVQHAAKAAPLDFGPVAERVAAAEAEPGRGKKVLPITFSWTCPDGAKDDTERTYGQTAWKRAENAQGGKTCEHAVLGLVVAGEHYGESFHVCIARDRCRTHWAENVKAKEKAAKLRASGDTKKAAKVEKKTESSWEVQQRKRDEEHKAWEALKPHALSAVVAKIKPAAITDKVLSGVISAMGGYSFKLAEVEQLLGEKVTTKTFTRALAVCDLLKNDHVRSAFTPFAKKYSVDLKALEKTVAPPAAAAPAKKGKGKK